MPNRKTSRTTASMIAYAPQTKRESAEGSYLSSNYTSFHAYQFISLMALGELGAGAYVHLLESTPNSIQDKNETLLVVSPLVGGANENTPLEQRAHSTSVAISPQHCGKARGTHAHTNVGGRVA